MKKLTEEELRHTVEMVPGYFCHVSATGHFLWLDPAWENLLGHPVSAMGGTSVLEYIHPDDRHRTVQVMSVLATGEPMEGFVNRYLTKTGGLVHLEWAGRSHNGVLYALARDVTRRVANEQRLAEYHHLLQLAGDIARIGHWRVDLVADTLHWSPQTFRIHGMDPDGSGPSLAHAIDVYHPQDRADVEAAVSKVASGGGSFEFEKRIIRTDGEERLVRSRGVAEVDATGRTIAIIGIFQDLTDERRMLLEVKESERLASITNLAAGIAHEINNPLQYLMAGIESLAELIDALRPNSKNDLIEDAQATLVDCRHGVNQVKRIVGDLRTLTNGPQDAHTLELLDIAEASTTAVSMTRHEFTKDGCRPVLCTHAPTARIRGNSSELIQVFMNLLTNAHHATVSAGSSADVRMATFTDRDGNIIVEVRDNGTGVPPELHTRIFEPFFTTKPLGIGHGMGLHICRTIVRDHGGDLSVDSRPGRTVFRLRLPPGESISPQEAAPDALPRVLIVDDDARVARGVSMMLRRQFDCTVHNEPEAALATLLGSSFDVVISDIMMPGMTGWELAQRAIQERPALASRMILMSGAAPDEYRPEQAPELPFLQKPFTREDLCVLIDAVLASAQ